MATSKNTIELKDGIDIQKNKRGKMGDHYLNK
jgi:hypothetical protein